MDYQLVVIRGRSETDGPLKLGNGITTVGRQEDCQLRINSSQVSRKHCQLFEKKGMLLVKDLGSSNGTFVNGKKVQDQKVLEPGDELTVGQVKFRVERVRPASGAKLAGTQTSGETAIAAAISGTPLPGAPDEDIFDIDFDEQVAAAPASPLSDTPLPPTGASEPPVPPEEDPFLPSGQVPGEDAVAEFLLNIELDDEDKR